MNLIGYIIFAVLLLLFFYITYSNSAKHGYILLAIAACSFGVWYIRPVQMYSLLGIPAALGVMLYSRAAREKAIKRWFLQNGFKPLTVPNAGVFFSDRIVDSTSYQVFQNAIAGAGKTIPFIFTDRFHTYRTGKTMSLEVTCSFYFSENVQANELEAKLKAAREQTPHTNLIKSQLRYFDLKGCDIFTPSIGGVAITWRVPHTIEGYSDRFEWIKNIFK